MSDPTVSVREAVAMLGVSAQWVCRLLRGNELGGFKRGKNWRIPAGEVRTYRERRLQDRSLGDLGWSVKRVAGALWPERTPGAANARLYWMREKGVERLSARVWNDFQERLTRVADGDERLVDGVMAWLLGPEGSEKSPEPADGRALSVWEWEAMRAPFSVEARLLLEEALLELEPAEEELLNLRFLKGESLLECGRVLGISDEMVRQRQIKVIRKIRAAIRRRGFHLPFRAVVDAKTTRREA